MKLTKVKLIDKINESDNIITFKFEVPKNFTWTEGAHVHVAFNDFMEGPTPDRSKVRTFSIISRVDEEYIGITTKISEKCSEYKQSLKNLNPMDEMTLFKIGNNMELIRSDRPIVMLSMGVGIATFRPLILSFNENSEGIKKIINLNVDSGKNYLYKEEFDKLNIRNFTNTYVNCRKALYEMIDKSLKDHNNIYYIVGSDNFLKDICRYLTKNSVSEKDIVIDKKVEQRKEFITI